MNHEFWSGKRVLVTGTTGFKGSWLSLWLESLGAAVSGIGLKPSSEPSMFNLCGITGTSIVDITNLHALKEHFLFFKPEIVFHLAAQSLVRESYKDPVYTYLTNVMGTVNVLEAVRLTDSVKSSVIVTTDKCYENFERIDGYREDDRLGGFDPYSNSKACAELVTASYRGSFLPGKVATARAGNVIGGGDWCNDRLIPDIVRAITRKESLRVRNPDAIRPWQHVLEPLSGYLELAQRLFLEGASFSEAWNFGPTSASNKSVRWVIEEFLPRMETSVQVILDTADQPKETKILTLNSDKAKTKLAWAPKWSIETAIAKSAEWYLAYMKGSSDLRELTLKQIGEYQND